MNTKKPIFVSGLRKILDLYCDYCIENHKESTLPSDFSPLKSFDSYLASQKYDGGNIPIAVITDWINQISSQFSPKTISNYESVISALLRFSTPFGIDSKMPDRIKVPDLFQPYIFSEYELELICSLADNMQYCKRSLNPWIQAEIPMLIRIGIGCGTRVTELLSLRMYEINLESGYFHFHSAKNDKERIVPMKRELQAVVERYCIAMGIIAKPEAFVFPGRNRDVPLKRRVYNTWFNKIIEAAGIKVHREKQNQHSVSVYCLRHTFGCNAVINLKKQGVHVDSVYPYLSVYMGHRNLYSTEKYLKMSDEMIADETSEFEKTMIDILECRVFQDHSEWV